jgi:hypothetical protein
VIFSKIKTDSIVQEGDGTRIDARKSIVPNFGEVADVLISPNIDGENDLPFISVYNAGNFDRWFLDWVYEAGSYSPTVKIVDDAEQEYTISKEITVLTEEADALFSNDDDLLSSEPDIYRYLPQGKTSYTFMHREAQRRILAFLDEQRIWKKNGKRYEKSDVFDSEEFVHWSRFMCLHLIFAGKVVEPDDFFSQKASDYKGLMVSARSRATLRLSSDGEVEVDIKKDRISTIQVRR